VCKAIILQAKYFKNLKKGLLRLANKRFHFRGNKIFCLTNIYNFTSWKKNTWTNITSQFFQFGFSFSFKILRTVVGVLL